MESVAIAAALVVAYGVVSRRLESTLVTGPMAFVAAGLRLWEAALLAAVLAPTDAALGQAVVTNRDVPVRIRETLSVESGLNDGIALPLVTLFLGLAAGEEAALSGRSIVSFVGMQLGVGVLAGAVVGVPRRGRDRPRRPPRVEADAGGRTLLYAVLSLTVVRLAPVALSLLGTRLSALTLVFVGWFGPRGLASILLAVLIIEEADIAVQAQITTVVSWTVLLSVFAHGMSARPAAQAYGRHVTAMGDDHAEHHPDGRRGRQGHGAA